MKSSFDLSILNIVQNPFQSFFVCDFDIMLGAKKKKIVNWETINYSTAQRNRDSNILASDFEKIYDNFLSTTNKYVPELKKYYYLFAEEHLFKWFNPAPDRSGRISAIVE